MTSNQVPKRRMLPSGTSSTAGWLVLLLPMMLLLSFLSSTTLDERSELVTRRQLSKHHHKHQIKEPIDYPDYSCDSLSRVQAKYPYRFDRCEFAKTCNDGEGIIFPFLFCDDGSSHVRGRQSLLLVFLSLVLLLLFRLLSSTFDEFFRPGLEMFSLQFGLPPRFAGVSLLALGNGAPDVATTMNAMTGDPRRGYEMALGMLTGCCMFITCLILGAIVEVGGSGSGDKGKEAETDANDKSRTRENGKNELNKVVIGGEEEADGVPCRGPLLRDVAVLVLVCVASMSYLKVGVVDYGFVYTLLGIYGAYVLLVGFADAYHIFYHVPSLAEKEGTGDEDRPPLVADEQTSLVAPKASHYRSHSEGAYTGRFRIDTVIEAMSNYSYHEEGQLTLTASSESSNISQDELEMKRSSPDAIDRSGGWGPVHSDGIEPIVAFHMRHAAHPHHGTGGLLFLQNRSSPASGRRHRKSFSADASLSTPTASLTAAATPKPEDDMAAVMQVAAASSHATISRPGSWGEALTINAEEVVDHWRDFFADIYCNKDNSFLEVVFLSVELPFTIIRKLTNPVPCDGYYCRPMVAVSVALSPLWLWFYFTDQFDIDMYSSHAGYVVSASTFLAALFVMRYAPGGEGPMDIYMVIPLTLYGFVIAATLLDYIADQLVELLDLFGILLKIPPTVMGLTVLAFGNSVQDFVANVSLSRKGLSTMATTACFAGPIFNLCFGLGFGFWALMKSTGKDHIRVELPRNIATGFWFTIANCGLIVFSGVVIGKGVIGRGYGYVACGLYVVYVVTSLCI